MGFFKKLFGGLIGGAAVAGGAVATTKVVQKVKENNPDGVGDVNEDGQVDYKDYVEEVKKAATEVYAETSDKVKEAAPEVKEKVDAFVGDAKDKVGAFVDDAKDKAIDAYANVSDKVRASDVMDKVNSFVDDAKDKVGGFVDTIKDKAGDIIDDDNIENFVEEAAETFEEKAEGIKAAVEEKLD